MALALAGWCALVASCCANGPPSAPAPSTEISPEQAGYSAERLAEVESYLASIGSAAFVALHDGKAFMSWGHVDTRYPIHSIRKALVSALYGIYVERGLVDLDATLGELGIDDIPPGLTDAEKGAKVRDLIGSRSGVYHAAAAESELMMADRPSRGSHRPGEHFYYNNWDFNVAGAILEQATGASVFELFEREIAGPIGMTSFSADDGFYQHEEEKSRYPAYHLRMTANDLARFGVLYLRGGRWNGRQIVPEPWIGESTRTRSTVSEEMGLGYGWMWYTTLEDDESAGSYFHTGAGVHMLAVLPAHDLVWVHRVDTERDYAVTSRDLAVLWQLLLDARVAE
jgi:CubicO group peptidase (beta-lactamase class C family)